MRECSRCGGDVEDVFRFCPWCGERRRTKLVEFFRPHPRIDSGRALRVSRYFGRAEEQHVRFSVWSESKESAQAEAAVSLGREEAARLALFLLDPPVCDRPRGFRDAVSDRLARRGRPSRGFRRA